MIQTTLRWGVLVGSLMLLGACAVGQKISYQQEVNVLAKGSSQLAVGVHDRRPYVVSGDKVASFVGIQRGGYGNPFDVNTPDGQPLATSVATSMQTSLERSGFGVKVVPLSSGQSSDRAMEFLTGESADLHLLLDIRELKSDTMTNAAFHYDVTLSVYRDGEELASTTRKGEDNLGGSFWDPGSHAQQAVPEAWGKLLEALLNEAEVRAALEG